MEYKEGFLLISIVVGVLMKHLLFIFICVFDFFFKMKTWNVPIDLNAKYLSKMLNLRNRKGYVLVS